MYYYSIFGDLTRSGNPYALDLAHERYQTHRKRADVLENEIRKLVSVAKHENTYASLEKIIYYLSEIKKHSNRYVNINWYQLNETRDLELQIALLCHIKVPHWTGTDFAIFLISALFFQCDKATIRVWLPQNEGEAGHASIQTDVGRFNKNGVYISVWPNKDINKRKMHRFFVSHKAVLHTKNEDLIAEQRPADFKKSLHMFSMGRLEAYYMFLKLGLCRWHLMTDVVTVINEPLFITDKRVALLAEVYYQAYSLYLDTGDHIKFQYHIAEIATRMVKDEPIVNCSSLVYMILKAIGEKNNLEIGLSKFKDVPPEVEFYYNKARQYLEKVKSCRVWTPTDIRDLALFLEAKEKYLKCAFDYFTKDCYEKNYHSPWINYWQKTKIEGLEVDKTTNQAAASSAIPPEDETSTLNPNGRRSSCALF